MTVAELEERMTSKEFSEWMAYFAIEPFGEDRADLRMGILASVMANLWGKRKGRAWRPQDFIPRFDRRDADPMELLRRVKMINRLLGGRDETHGAR
jgi:hypothetical protein